MSFGALWKAMLISAGIAATAYLIAHAVMFLMGGGTIPYPLRPGSRAEPRTSSAYARTPPSPEAIVASGLFGHPPRDPSPGTGPGPELPAATGLPACGGRLVGIVVDVLNPRASIAATVGSEGPRVRRASDQDVEKIEPERVLLREGEAICELRLFAGPPAALPIDPSQRAAGAAGASGAIPVSAEDARADDATIERELRTVRALPRDGGVVLYGIRRGTLLDRLGLKNGDVIREVDGHPVTDLDAMLDLHTRLRNGTLEGADVILERRGERQAVRYQLR